MKRAPRQSAVAVVVVAEGETAEIAAAGAAVAGGAIVTSNKFHIQLLTVPCALKLRRRRRDGLPRTAPYPKPSLLLAVVLRAVSDEGCD